MPERGRAFHQVNFGRRERRSPSFHGRSCEACSRGLALSVYRKLTHSGIYLDYESARSVAHQRSVARSLVQRAIRTCSDATSLKEELQTIEDDLIGMGTPNIVCGI